MLIRGEVQFNADHLVAMVGAILERADRSGSDRAFILTELRALASNPAAFLDFEVSVHSLSDATAMAVPGARLERLLERFGGAA
ncbi:hypothetical protein [Thalassovita aquimarina]|uniref:Uncharacterized protein n=1 Tax=Thalassovita aquimarina TaxID=2785917 RepID=A0ABS5HSE7_9RHOB|nr:hypothetical protein [Thalassovita aquimarina]MBR9651895.1 hypothetical protein [Thalassovita aquimarina]